MSVEQRDISIDVLRAIALLGVIVVHINPNPFICQLRGFDVPLFVFLSGVVFAKNRKPFQDIRNILVFYKERLIRILIPIYLFFAIYFTYVYVSRIYTVSFSDVLSEMTLFTHWYVWIFRVLLLLAFLSPLLLKFTMSFSMTTHFIIFAIVLGIMEVLLNNDVVDENAWYYYIVELIPYIYIYIC